MSFSRDSQKTILTAARDAWPDLTRFFEDLTAERLNWRQLMETFVQSGGTQGIPTEYGVAVWFPLLPSEEFSGVGTVYESRCDLYYIMGTLEPDGSPMSVADIRQAIQEKGEEMEAALKALTDVTVVSVSIDASPGNLANAYYLEKQLNLAAVLVSCTYLTAP